ncbi:MAG: O-antigen ligase family protein [bacterium]
MRHEKHVSIRQINIAAAIGVAIFLMNYSIQLFPVVSPEDWVSLLDGILIAGSIAAVFLSAINFELSLNIFIFIAPLAVYSIPNLNFFFTYGDAYLIVLVFIWISRLALSKESSFRKTYLDRLIFFFVVLTLLSAISSRDSGEAIKEIVQTIEYLVFCYYLFSVAVNNRNLLDCIIHSIVLCGGLIALYGILQYMRGGGGEFRIYGTFGHFNAMGTFMAMMTTFMFNLSLSADRGWKRLLYYTVFVLDFLALLMTFSRGAWIGTIVGVVISAQIRGMVQFIRIFSMVFVLFIIVTVLTPQQYFGRYLVRLYSVPRVADVSSKNRVAQWKIAYETISDYPLLGVGLNNNSYHVTEKYNLPTYGEIHNLFLHIGSERGIPAMFIFMGIYISYFVHIYRRIGRTEDPYFHSLYVSFFSVILAFFVVNIFAYQLIRGIALFFVMFLALSNAAMNIEENEPVESKWAEMLSTLESKRPLAKMGL